MREKILKPVISLLLAACLALGLMPSAMAEGTAKEYPDSFFEGRTWEELVDELIQECKIQDGTFSAGYKNLVTGEEHYYDPDTLYLSASMYKVPLNMYWSNQVYNGNIDWSFTAGGVAYDTVIEWSIVNSNNEFSEALCTKIGSLREYRTAMLPFVGETEDSVDPLFFRNNYYNAKQMIFCLDELYTNSEQYPRVLELMKKAKPGKYFKEHDNGVEIAHKFGYLFEQHSVSNDCGIIYTEDPIALVVFTCNAYHGYNFLVQYCDMMIAYTEYHTRERKAQEELDAARQEKLDALELGAAEGKAEADALYQSAAVELGAALTARMTVAEAPEEASSETEGSRTAAVYLAAGAGVLAALVLLVFAVIRKRKNPAVIAGCAVLLIASCALAFSARTGAAPLSSSAKSSPLEGLSVFDSLEAEIPGSETADDLARYLAENLEVEAVEESEVNGNTATVTVRCTAVDWESAKDELTRAVESSLEQYRTEIADCEDILSNETDYSSPAKEACAAALRELLSSPEPPVTQTELVITLTCSDGQWTPVCSQELLSACGA